MTSHKIIIKSLACFFFFFLVGCEDKVIEGVADRSIDGQDNIESCSSGTDFGGVRRAGRRRRRRRRRSRSRWG